MKRGIGSGHLKSLLSLKYFSFSTKVVLLFFILILLSSILRTMISIPKDEKIKYDEELADISRVLEISREEISLLGKSIKMQTDLEVELNKKRIEDELKSIDLNSSILDKKSLLKQLSKNKVLKICKFTIDSNDHKNIIFNTWYKVEENSTDRKYRKDISLNYNYLFKNFDISFSTRCTNRNLNPNHISFELDIKKHFNTNLLVDSDLRSSRTVIFWVNKNVDKDEVLYVDDLDKSREKYRVSLLSNMKNIPTGNLTLNEILDKRDNQAFEHQIEGRTVVSWIIGLSTNEKRYSILVHTVDKKELLEKSKSTHFRLFIETLVAMGISFILIFFIFRKRLKKIDRLTQTATLVNQGKRNIRSGVVGDDDIGILGRSFDKMLDSLENSIKTLDSKVEEKTKEISRSLEEKEILLKEIHHRVKNNLALTISLIELQEEDVSDEETKKVLRDIQERIYTMELLHRKLYESDNLNKIVLKNYIIDLVDTITSSYSRREEVDISIDVNEMELDIQSSMPLGIILNEFITNAFKYAFNEEGKHYLNITILNPKDGEIELIVEDSGKGLKEDFHKISNKTLGLKLINMIVKYQLKGDISYEYKDGAVFNVKGILPSF